MRPKRPAKDATANQPASKKPKTNPSLPALEAIEETLKKLKANLFDAKKQYQATDTQQAEEHEKELAAKDAEIEKLKGELEASKCQTHIAVTLREGAERLSAEAQAAEEQAKEDLKQQRLEEARLGVPRRKVVEAAQQVQEMLAGMGLQNMGAWGEALQKMDKALRKLHQVERDVEEE
ncbi:hypothetical protein PRZ48_002837 [Zasmidium cellare]|uniref:Uncharacterized protein n=1 Tax=Zasmidium cellare TaxID=395010 RepID=A0ABR0ETB5_ZASCE|nr:hypothetical protein PRZ48_002837 [Zasmidium cellare]